MQAQILSLLVDLQHRFETAILFVSHDLGVVAQTCRRVYVMYAGRIVEEAPISELFASPRHPYTVGLLSSLPSLDPSAGDSAVARDPRFAAGSRRAASGVSFRARCPISIDECALDDVVLAHVGAGHSAACLRHEAVAGGAVVYGVSDSRVNVGAS